MRKDMVVGGMITDLPGVDMKRTKSAYPPNDEKLFAQLLPQ